LGAEQECDYPSRTLKTSSCKIISSTFLLPIVHVEALRIKVVHVWRVGGLSEMLLLIMV
jgi:hypothetical protein